MKVALKVFLNYPGAVYNRTQEHFGPVFPCGVN